MLFKQARSFSEFVKTKVIDMTELLDPKILMKIKDLSLAAKTTIDGFMSGINHSSIKGAGMEFSQYRSYQPGDDLRSLDWKMYARSDRYYIRESEIDTSIAIRFLMDASASMNHEEDGITKIQYARYLVAALAYLAHLQSDAVGLYVFQKGSFFSMSPRQDYQHLARFFYQLEQIHPEGKFIQPMQYQEIYAGSQKRELIILVTDLYEQNQEIMQLLDSLNALKHEVIVFHLMGKNELELNYKGYSTLEDLETGETIQVNGNQVQKVYQEKLENFLKEVRTNLLNRNIVYRFIRLDQPLDQALRDFLIRRNKLKT